MPAFGTMSRVSSAQTALRNCTRDEGRSFEVGNQVLIAGALPCKHYEQLMLVFQLCTNSLDKYRYTDLFLWIHRPGRVGGIDRKAGRKCGLVR
jgi:hypothetical protein